MSRYPTERFDRRIQAMPALLPDPDVSRLLRRLVYSLAREQEDIAAKEAALVPYWKPCPHSVIGIRVAARVLREAAEALPDAMKRSAREVPEAR